MSDPCYQFSVRDDTSFRCGSSGGGSASESPWVLIDNPFTYAYDHYDSEMEYYVSNITYRYIKDLIDNNKIPYFIYADESNNPPYVYNNYYIYTIASVEENGKTGDDGYMTYSVSFAVLAASGGSYSFVGSDPDEYLHLTGD